MEDTPRLSESPAPSSGVPAPSSGVTADRIWELEPVLRRVLSARLPHDATQVDDLVHDALERLLKARERLSDEALVPYSVTTAENLAADYGRRINRHRQASSKLVDPSEPSRPDDEILEADERSRVGAALRRLPDADRIPLVAHDIHGVPVADLAGPDVSAGTMRVRLARARTKLWVEYVLLSTKTSLPTASCRPTLLALASGDRARQEATTSGRHLAACPTCQQLAGPVAERRRGLVALVPLVSLSWLWKSISAHPAPAAAVGAVATAGVAAGIAVAATQSPPQPLRAAPPAVAAPAAPAQSPPPVDLYLSATGQSLLTAAPAGSLLPMAGQSVTARSVVVQSVASHNGFWVGDSPQREVWVELVGPLRSFQLSAGQHVSFVAQVVTQDAHYAESLGLTPGEGAAQLDAEGAHLSVATTAISIGS